METKVAYIRIRPDTMPTRINSAGRLIADAADFRAVEYSSTDDILEAVSGQRGDMAAAYQHNSHNARFRVIEADGARSHAADGVDVLLPGDTSYPPVTRV